MVWQLDEIVTKFLNAADIAAADDLATEDVLLPDWGGTVIVRELNVAERLALGDLAEGDPKSIVFWLVVWGLVDEAGAQIFDDPKAGIEVLRRKSFDSIRQLAAKVRELSGMGGDSDDDDDADPAEELEKN